MNDGDSKTKIEKPSDEGDPYSILQRFISDVGNVFSPARVRRIIQVNDGSNWFILGCRYRFLLPFRILLVVLYFTFEIFG
jgi:hypothetical protein